MEDDFERAIRSFPTNSRKSRLSSSRDHRHLSRALLIAREPPQLVRLAAGVIKFLRYLDRTFFEFRSFMIVRRGGRNLSARNFQSTEKKKREKRNIK